MAKFERSERKDNRGPRTSSPRRDNRGSRSFGDNPRGNRGYSDRDSGYGGGRRDVEKTRVTCDSCGSKCEVPFKPTSNKPVYCDDCFS